jgi:hypothetical protein
MDRTDLIGQGTEYEQKDHKINEEKHISKQTMIDLLSLVGERPIL